MRHKLKLSIGSCFQLMDFYQGRDVLARQNSSFPQGLFFKSLSLKNVTKAASEDLQSMSFEQDLTLSFFFYGLVECSISTPHIPTLTPRCDCTPLLKPPRDPSLLQTLPPPKILHTGTQIFFREDTGNSVLTDPWWPSGSNTCWVLLMSEGGLCGCFALLNTKAMMGGHLGGAG